jgi:signal transduction histidine kinase
MGRDLLLAVCHELRTPVTSIQGCLEALLDGVAEGGPRLRRCLEMMCEETRRLNRLIDDLFEYARLEAGDFSMRFDVHDLADVARSSLENAAVSAERAGVSLEARVPAGGIMVRMDRDRIRQVFDNLLDNAIRFTPKGGRVTLAVGTNGPEAVASVEDTGMGIDPEDLPRVFERYYRAPAARAVAGVKGAGLGLAICRHLVEAHRGRIWVESEPGKGSIFRFTLPLGG